MRTLIRGITLVFMGYLAYMLYRYAEIIGLVVLALASVAIIGFMAFTAWFAIEKMLMIRADRIAREKEAHIMVVTQGTFVGIRDTSRKAEHWQVYNSPRQIPASHPMLPDSPISVDLLAALDSVQRCLIVGASDAGKTTLLQHLIARRRHKVIVIDPHSWPGKWPTATVIGTGRNYTEIGKALDALMRLMTKRYDEIGRGVVTEMGHPRVMIIIDEWRAITQNLGKPASEAIKALLTESRKAAFSVFVASHSERAKPLGLEGEYDLKDGFTVVRLEIVNGQYAATIDTGTGEQPATLPGKFYGTTREVIEPDEVIKLNEMGPEPDETEASILDLWDRGITDKRKIAKRTIGVGGNQYRRIDEILVKFGRV